jgi:4-hydroxybenzoate polyprenyltransferase
VKLRNYLSLLRPPNVFTSVADVLAGFLYVGGWLDDWITILLLALISACLYGAGIAFNDVCDLTRDAVQRPDRPIPSGRVSRSAALLLIGVLVIVALKLSALVSSRTLATTGLLVLAIILYDWAVKSTPLAPGVMGCCRALNVALGMSIVPLEDNGTAVGPLVLMWFYVTSLTFFARKEGGDSERARLILGTLGVCSAVIGLALIVPPHRTAHGAYFLFVAALSASLAYLGIIAIRDRSQPQVQRTVGHFVMAIILIDLAIAWAARGLVVATPIALLLVPTLLLRKWFRMT